MRALIELGADVNKPGDDNMTPLHYAARYSKKASASALKALRMRGEQRKVSVSPTFPNSSRRKSSSAPPPLTPTSAGSPAGSRRNSDSPDFEGLNPATATAIQV